MDRVYAGKLGANMTREKAIDLLDNLIGMVEDNQESDYDTALKMGKQALSQEPICDRDCEHCTWTECPIEPCDDAISRQAVINAIENDCMRGGLGSCFACYNDAQAFRGEIEKLPPVTQKLGKWIDEGWYAEGHSEHAYRCSECDEHYIGYVGEHKFCPNCGAKMESEDV